MTPVRTRLALRTRTVFDGTGCRVSVPGPTIIVVHNLYSQGYGFETDEHSHVFVFGRLLHELGL